MALNPRMRPLLAHWNEIGALRFHHCRCVRAGVGGNVPEAALADREKPQTPGYFFAALLPHAGFNLVFLLDLAPVYSLVKRPHLGAALLPFLRIVPGAILTVV